MSAERVGTAIAAFLLALVLVLTVWFVVIENTNKRICNDINKVAIASDGEWYCVEAVPLEEVR